MNMYTENRGMRTTSHKKHLGDLCTESGQTLQGSFSVVVVSPNSFSAVSKPIFATKYSLESSRRDLQNALLCTALESQFFFQNFAKILTKFVDILLIFADFAKILQYFDEISPKFHRNFTRI